jgi:hypothetical protein
VNSPFELILGVLLAAGGVYFVLRPILAPSTAGSAPGDSDTALDPEDDLSARAVALRALKEIEFDRATGKLGDADYDALKGKYTAEALEALREDAAVKVPPEAARRPAGAAPASRAAAPSAARACPTHGARPESDADFCSECGRRLAPAAGFCSRCGTSLEPDARFCARCGGRVAA